jgi:tricorn protease
VSINVPADSTTTLPQPVNAAENIESFSLSPGGERVGIVARGDVFSVPVEHGVTRNLTRSSNAHDREAAWSNDGTRLAYVSDRSGEEEIYVQAQDGNSPAASLTANSTGRYSAPVWSGDDKRIAFADNTNRLYVVDIAGKKRTVVTQDPVGLSLDYRWSPDGRFLAYSRNDANGFSSVFVWSLADGQSHRITPQSFAAQSPAWSPNGELLYFLSQREYQPIISTVEFNFATDRQTGIFAVTLRKDVKNPFGIRDDEPGEDKDADAEKDKPKGKAKPKPLIKVDFDGIENRTIRIPLEADNISNLRVGEENLLYLRSGAFYYGREPGIKPTVMSYSIKEREAKPVAEDVTEWSATADGKHVLAELPSKEFKYFEVGKSDDAKAVSLAGLMTYRVPAAEWREIFAEVWRRYRDYFYVENMHGYDWAKLRGKYQPLLDHVGHRTDLNYVISEMIAELTVQHAYIEGGDLGLPKRPFVALPGARFELDAKSGRYRIAKIFAGENEEERYRSPLTEVGVDVHVGDYVLSINGRELEEGTDPYELLQAPAGQPVEWRVAATADGAAARTIRYQPLHTEADLLYLDWAAQNRARVDALSHGRLGYIHLPDMGDGGIREFIKWWYPQVRKEGLVVDVRDNAGGNVSEMLIERLAGVLQETRFGRNHAAAGTYPSVVQPGPKVALINEGTSSDGDIFSYQFRQWKIGRLVGKRTWGGVVGISDHGTLLDGGKVFVPEFGTADENGRWIIEGHGVDPDIVVEQDPLAVLNGHDPQLERGIQELLKLLPATPGGLPRRPVSPIKSEVH